MSSGFVCSSRAITAASVISQRISKKYGQLFISVESNGRGIDMLNKNDQVMYANKPLADYLDISNQEVEGANLEFITQKIPAARQDQLTIVEQTGIDARSPPSVSQQKEGKLILVNTANQNANTTSSITSQNCSERGDDDDS
jgi:PAS domain-containing protein